MCVLSLRAAAVRVTHHHQQPTRLPICVATTGAVTRDLPLWEVASALPRSNSTAISSNRPGRE